MKTTLFILTVAMSIGVAGAREFRTITNSAGVSIEAEILDYSEGTLKIRSQRKVFEIPVDTLSQADQDWIAEWDAKRQGKEEDLYYSEVIFEDDFSGDGFGEKWGHYKSESVIQDGVLIGKTIDINDHAGVDNIRFEGRKDMEVSVKFNFMSEEAQRFNVWFDDKDYKGSHAGHVASIALWPGGLSITDAKTGNMENSIYEKKKSPEGLDEETKELLETKTVKFDADIERETWHSLKIRTKGDTITVFIDDDEIGSLTSEGNSHPTKSLVSLTTNVNDVHYDDFVVKAAENVEEPAAE
ncbi:MAG: hypothetical protein CMO55_29190 [Verrucomicrobiales bacterium]|nr:hypothetical protein [Verrucomicrobiales bacterium]